MAFTKSLLALSLLSFSREAFSTDYTWSNGAESGEWRQNGNWSVAGFPQTITDSASMPAGIDGAVTVVDDAIIINSITFNGVNFADGYTIERTGLPTITFGGASPFITLSGGSHIFSIPVRLAADTTVNLNSTDEGGLRFYSAISPDVNGTRTLTFTGSANAIYNALDSGSIGSIILNGGANVIITGINGQSAKLQANSFNIENGTIAIGTTMGTQIRGALQSNGNISIGANGKITSLYDGIIYLANGGTGNLFIADGGRLEMGEGSGNGLIQSVNGSSAITVTNSGSVAPLSGDFQTPGNLSIGNGNGSTYHQTETGVLDLFLDTSKAPGRKLSYITTTNFILDSGSTLNVNVANTTGMVDGDSFPVLIAYNGAGTLAGTFSNINLIGDLPEGINMTALYNANQYELFGLLFSSASPSPIPVVPPVVVPAINTSITSYIGGSNQAVFTSVNNTNIRLGRQMKRVRGNFTENVSSTSPNANPVAASASGFNIDGLLVDSNEKITLQREDSATKSPKTPATFYTGGIGNSGDVNKKSGQAGFNYWSAGALAGFDYAFSQVGVGILTSYERTDAHVDASWGKFTIDQIHASLYATYAPEQLPAISVNVIGGGGYEIYDIHRNTPASTAKGYPKGYEVDGLLEIDYTFSGRDYTWMPERLYFGPVASVQYIYLEKGKYRERGASSYDLTVSRQTTDSLRSFLGANLNYTIQHRNVEFTPQVYAGWQREFRNKNKSQSFAPILVGGAASSVLVVGAGRNIALTGVDLKVTFFKKYQIDASYDFEWNDLFQDNSVYLGFNLQF